MLNVHIDINYAKRVVLTVRLLAERAPGGERAIIGLWFSLMISILAFSFFTLLSLVYRSSTG